MLHFTLVGVALLVASTCTMANTTGQAADPRAAVRELRNKVAARQVEEATCRSRLDADDNELLREDLSAESRQAVGRRALLVQQQCDGISAELSRLRDELGHSMRAVRMAAAAEPPQAVVARQETSEPDPTPRSPVGSTRRDQLMRIAAADLQMAGARGAGGLESGPSPEYGRQLLLLTEFLVRSETQPDPRSPIGGGAVRLTAGLKDGSASIKYVLWEDDPKNPMRGTSLTLTTPAAKQGTTTLLSTDGLANASTLAVGGYFKRGLLGADAGGKVYGLQGGWTATTGYERRDYIDRDTSKKAQSQLLRPYSLSIYLAGAEVSGVGSGGNLLGGMHLATVKLLRSNLDGKTRILCPTSAEPVLTCVNGPIGPPGLQHSREFAYEYRWRTSLADLWPRVSYNDVSSLKEVSLPIYFVRQGEKSPFTAGLKLNWSSKEGGSVGVFVGTPLNWSAGGS